MYKRIVVKLGTNVLTNKSNKLVHSVIDRITHQIADLNEKNIEVILVSSGSVIAGKEIVGNISVSDKALRRQIFASIGQPKLMKIYQESFNHLGLNCAQILATKNDFSNQEKSDNLKLCFESILEQNVIPIINENDAMSYPYSMFSDNDELAVLVANLTNADALFLLSDVDGFYDGNPSEPLSKVIHQISPFDHTVEKFIQENKKKEAEGRGGMLSKFKAAQRASSKGITTYIAAGKESNILHRILTGEILGTKFSD